MEDTVAGGSVSSLEATFRPQPQRRASLEHTMAAVDLGDTMAATSAELEVTMAARGELGDTMVAAGGLDATMASDAGLALRGQTRLERGASISRYVVLDKLGAGGMGVVFAAYDPELDRKIALKLLHGQAPGEATRETEAHQRLLREAQAMAKLGHPNVIAIHDVGEHEGRVFLAMEFVEGVTLGEWLSEQPRSLEQIVEVFAHAARGLIAAHDKGLIHRDFKPDNVMVAADGRVRVMDFGLARTGEGGESSERTERGDPAQIPGVDAFDIALTGQGALLGTPAYMAPEQWYGADTDARTDQFSFCVALYEALYGERPFEGESVATLVRTVTEGQMRPQPSKGAPVWLRRLITRGLATEPDARFPSMSAVLAELSTGEQRRRKRRSLAVLAALGLVLGSGFGLRHYQHNQRVATCAAEGAALASLWNEDTRASLRAGMLASEAGYAETMADKVLPWLDGQVARLGEASTQACMHRSVDARWDEPTYARASWCLDERRTELATVIDVLSAPDKKTVQQAMRIVIGLEPVDSCLDELTLAGMAPLPPADRREQVLELQRELPRAKYLELAGKYDEGVAAGREFMQRAQALQWPPIYAAAAAITGSLLSKTGDYEQAEAMSTEAYVVAAKSGSWDVAAGAAMGAAWSIGYRQARHDEGLDWLAHAEVAIAHSGDPTELLEAERLTTLSSVKKRMGKNKEAEQHLLDTVRIRERALGPGHPQLAVSLGNLGNLYNKLGRYEEARDHTLRAIEIFEHNFGPEHRLVGKLCGNMGSIYTSLGDYERAIELHERALEIDLRQLGPDHPSIGKTYANLGNVYASMGELPRAIDHYRRGLAQRERALGPDHPDVGQILVGLGMTLSDQGEHAEAHTTLERAVEIFEAKHGEQHPRLVNPLLSLGQIALQLDQLIAATGYLERAEAIAALGEVKPQILAAARFELAKALVQHEGAQARSVELASAARDYYREAGPKYAQRLGEVEDWLAAGGGREGSVDSL